MVPLADGRVQVAGGGQSAEAYDPATQRSAWVTRGSSRSSFSTATALPDGTVLVVGGYDERIDLRRDAYVPAGA